MRRRTFIAAAGSAALPFMPVGAAAAPLRVIASFSILADLVHQIGGDAVAVETLAGPDEDVHVFEPRPKDLRKLLAAGLLVRNGLGLEGWMDRLIGSAGFKGAVAVAAEQVTPRTMKDQGGSIAIDPHAWQDPENAILYVQSIARGLAAADASRAAEYAVAAKVFARRIADADARIAAQLSDIPAERRRIITTHDAFGYYGARYGVEFLSAEGINTDAEPSARSIAALIGQIKRENIRAVFIENMTGDRMARMLARETGAVLGGTVYSDALSPPDGPAATYLDMLSYNTALFVKAMRA